MFMSNPENREPDEFHKKLIESTVRFQNMQDGLVPYKETSECRRIERIIIEKNKSRVGKPEPVRCESTSEEFLKALIKYGPLSEEQLTIKFPYYGYAISRLMVVQVDVGHVIMEGNVYQITELGRQSIKYGFDKKFLKLNKR